MTQFILNRDVISTDLPAGTVTLDLLRRERRLTGTKEGCREGDCGACMVLLGEPQGDGVHYRAVNSCLLPVGDLAGRHVVTVEGLNRDILTPVQQAMVDEGASQCGLCTPGFIVSLAGFLLASPTLDVAAAEDAVAGNICRCTGYLSIRRAIASICRSVHADASPRLPALVAGGFVPAYFTDIPARLRSLAQATAPPEGAGPPITVAGGTDLFVQRPEALVAHPVQFISRRPDLRGIHLENGRCTIGAATPWADLEDAPEIQRSLPVFVEAFRLLASRPIRQRATVGGNLVNASPIGDVSIMLLALDADVILDDRSVPLREFYLGYKKLNKSADELVRAVAFTLPGPDAVLSFEKVSRRVHLDIASVNTAMQAVVRNDRVETMHLSAGGVGPVPLYLAQTSLSLIGAPLTTASVAAALDAMSREVTPITDVRGSAAYKRLLLRQLVTAHLLRLAPALEAEVAS